METTYDFAVVDSNTLPFVFKHAPEVANTLHINTELSFDAVKQSHQEDWMVVTLKLSPWLANHIFIWYLCAYS